jgi:hypothetical protein
MHAAQQQAEPAPSSCSSPVQQPLHACTTLTRADPTLLLHLLSSPLRPVPAGNNFGGGGYRPYGNYGGWGGRPWGRKMLGVDSTQAVQTTQGTKSVNCGGFVGGCGGGFYGNGFNNGFWGGGFPGGFSSSNANAFAEANSFGSGGPWGGNSGASANAGAFASSNGFGRKLRKLLGLESVNCYGRWGCGGGGELAVAHQQPCSNLLTAQLGSCMTCRSAACRPLAFTNTQTAAQPVAADVCACPRSTPDLSCYCRPPWPALLSPPVPAGFGGYGGYPYGGGYPGGFGGPGFGGGFSQSSAAARAEASSNSFGGGPFGGSGSSAAARAEASSSSFGGKK